MEAQRNPALQDGGPGAGEHAVCPGACAKPPCDMGRAAPPPPPGLWESAICAVSGPGCAGGPPALGSWVPALSEGFCHFRTLVK